MAASVHHPVSAAPLGYSCLPAGTDPFVAKEQVSPPSQPRDEHEHSPDDADTDPFPPDDDSRWDVFLPDADEIDPLPEPGDFWLDDD